MKPFICIMLTCCLVGCTSSKKIIYFQDLKDAKFLQQIAYKDITIKEDDLLSIVVSGPDKEVIQPYNLAIADGARLTDPDRSLLGYVVNARGEINFPNLGKIKVTGMTRSELEDYLMTEIGKDVKDPVVRVLFKNFKITILGEVRSPGTYTIASEKVNLLQALGMAGDLLISAKREDILLIREGDDDRQTHISLNLKSKEILESPYFYLQQNDVLYIPPSISRVTQARTATGVWSVILSSVTTAITIIALVTKK